MTADMNGTSDMESQMYTSVENIKKFLADDIRKDLLSAVSTPMRWEIPAAAMHKYTDLTDTEPRYQGGFIWDYIDQSIYEKRPLWTGISGIWWRLRRASD